jgi:hypothetical protein
MTIVEARSNKSVASREPYIQNPENIPYYEGETIYQRTYRHDRSKHQLEEDGETIHSTDDEFMQPLDEDDQGNSLRDEEIERETASTAQKTTNKEDSKPASESEAEESPLYVEQPRDRLHKRNHESEKNETNICKSHQREPKTNQRTRRETHHGNCGLEKN